MTEPMPPTARTAIARSAPSAPLRALLDRRDIVGNVLDYGCGRGADVYCLLEQGFDCRMYDPWFAPTMPAGQFDTILCTYVLNVLPPVEWDLVLDDIRKRLTRHGTAFITVRRDIPEAGTPTQWWVELDLPVAIENSAFTTYWLKN